MVMFRCYEASLVSHLINLVRLRSLLLRCQAHASGPLAEGFLGQLIGWPVLSLARALSPARAIAELGVFGSVEGTDALCMHCAWFH